MQMPAYLHEDNSTATQVLSTGISAALGYLDRTHRVNLSFVRDVLLSEDIPVIQTDSGSMVADAFTKGFTPAKWHLILSMLGMIKAPLGES